MKKLIIILLLCVSAISMVQEEVLLRLNYKVGDVYTSKIITKMDIINGESSDFTLVFVTEVVDIKDDVYTIKGNYERITNTSSIKGKEVDYDSNKNESEMDEETKKVHEQMKPRLEVVFSMKVDKKGKVLSTEVLKGDESLKNIQKGVFVEFPEKKVTVGSIWEVSRSQYKVINIDKENVEIEMFSNIGIGGKGFVKRKTGNMNPMNVKIVESRMITDIELVTTKK